MSMLHSAVWAGLVFLGMTLPVAASDEAQGAGPKDGPKEVGVSFYKDVRPILVEHCQGCHQPAKAGGKVILTSYAALKKGAKKEPLFVSGKPDESLLIEEITPQEGEPPEMPKDAPPLDKKAVAVLRAWIQQGGKDDTPETEKVQFTSANPPAYARPPVVSALDYSPNSQLVAISGHHEVLVHKADGSALVHRLVGLSERIQSVSFSPDGASIAVAAGNPGSRGEVQIWDVAKGKLRVAVTSTFDTLYGTSWSHDSKLVAFGCADNSVRAIDAKTGKQVLYQGAHNDWVLGTAFSKDSSHLVSVSRDRSMKLIQVKTQQFIDNITSITPGALKGGIMAIDRHPKKDHMLVGGADGAPKVYQIYRTKARKIGDDYNLIRKYESLPGRVFDVEFNADGSRFVAGSSFNNTGEVRLYQTDDGKLVWKSPIPGAVYGIAYRPDAKAVAAAGYDGVVFLIDGASGKITNKFVPVPRAF